MAKNVLVYKKSYIMGYAYKKINQKSENVNVMAFSSYTYSLQILN